MKALAWRARPYQTTRWRVFQLLLWLGSILPVLAADKPATPIFDREAAALVEQLLGQRPTKELSLEGIFKIRYSDGRRVKVPVKYWIRLREDHWESVYQTSATTSFGPEQLVIMHRPDQPNRYLFTQISLDGSKTNSMDLTGSEAAVSFAGSDFWLTDLGMEFLHWPEQHLVRDAKITMRLGRPCKVLESRNPRPADGMYRRVVSWIDSELGNLIYAEAYDLQNKHFKVFSLKGFKKVNGRWQVKDMELRNDKADSRTRLEFNFETE
jgi:hypothetical protein